MVRDRMVRERIGPVASFKTATGGQTRCPRPVRGKILRGTIQKISPTTRKTLEHAGHASTTFAGLHPGDTHG
jgi:hypothetical protein